MFTSLGMSSTDDPYISFIRAILSSFFVFLSPPLSSILASVASLCPPTRQASIMSPP